MLLSFCLKVLKVLQTRTIHLHLNVSHFQTNPPRIPIYRDKFTVAKKDLPQWILKRQLASECYRLLFSLSLNRHITAHRAQGATMRDCLISVDLGLDNPTSKLTNDITSVLYAAMMHTIYLKDLFVAPIHTEVCAKLGHDAESLHHQAINKELCECAKTFAAFNGLLDLVETELTPTDRDFDEEVERVVWMSPSRVFRFQVLWLLTVIIL